MADEVKYGLTREGFRRKRLPEILAAINKRVADKLGIEIQTGSNSIFGQIHGVYAYEIADLWEQAQAIYNAMYPNTATGTSLSNAAGLAGIIAITAEKTTAVCTCYGSSGTAIPYGSQIANATNMAQTWTCIDADAVISDRACTYASLDIPTTISMGNTYTLTINGDQKAYTAKEDDSIVQVLVGLSSQFTIEGVVLSTVDDILSVSASGEKQTFAIACSGLRIRSIGSPVTFQCDTAGAINPGAGTLTKILTAVAGWNSVANNAAAYVGRDAESDIALRQRWSLSLYDRAAAMTEAIAASIYANVDGVTTVKVHENDTDVEDDEGRPPHSVEAVVVGGDPDEIAEQIWRSKAGGIDTFGDTQATVIDSQGIRRTINFNRPEGIKVWLKVVIGKNPDEEFPPAGPQEIAAALLEKGNAQEIGEDVILQRYFSSVFKATTGVGYISLTAATGDTAGDYTTENIVINSRQIAVFDASRIEVDEQ